MASAPTSPTKRTPFFAQPTRSSIPATPLDYSFMGLVTLSDMLQNDPVSGKKKVTPAESATTGISDGTLSLPPQASTPTAVSLRVNNNKLRDLNDIDEALASVFEDPSKLQWIDLSGNALASIPTNAFAKYPDILTLHLHGNQLTKYSDIDHMASCVPKLHSLTMHSNPIEEKKHYRNYVVSAFPALKQLDFSSVTKGDREKADTWAKIYKHALQVSRAKGSKRGDNEYE